MSKKTLTVQDFIKAMELMTGNNSIFTVLKAIDPDLKDTDLAYNAERMKFYGEAYGLTEGEAAARMIREEGITNPVHALAAFGHVNFEVGYQRGKGSKENAISNVLDKLAKKMEENPNAIRGSFVIKNKDEDKSNRSPLSERDNTSFT